MTGKPGGGPRGRPLSFNAPHGSSVSLHSALLVAVAAVVATVTIAWNLKARRRYANLKVSGGRKSLVMNLFDRR